MNSKWDDNRMELKIREVLNTPEFNTDHHFKRPFLTAYQIGIAIVKKYPSMCNDLQMEFGGKDTGLENSLCQYIANQLSRRISNKSIEGIEGAFMANNFVKKLCYDNCGQEVESSNSGKEYLSMFRSII